MALAPVESGGETVAGDSYTLISAATVPRVNSDNTVQDVVQVTAQSNLFLVTYTWFVELATWQSDGGPQAVADKTQEVNSVCNLPHVIGFRTIQDQDASKLLVNLAVITVGTDDGSIQGETQVRMDQLGSDSVASQVSAVWAGLQRYGAT
jgi:hypothetical protein